jgi:hypothetical protein
MSILKELPRIWVEPRDLMGEERNILEALDSAITLFATLYHGQCVRNLVKNHVPRVLDTL